MKLTHVIAMILLLGSRVLAEGTPEPGKQVELSLSTTDGQSISYLLYLPKNYGNEESRFPLMLFLHGRGESFGPLSIVAKWGPPLLAGKGEDLPFILVSPQCPGDSSWSKPEQQRHLIELLDHMEANYRVDKSRVCLTGLSMGGFGSWTLGGDHPDRFSCIVPICGGGDPSKAPAFREMPLWVFHGDQDQAVPIARSVEMVDAVRAAGNSSIRFTTLEHVGHNSWSAAYASPELYEWILKQSGKRK